ncbi:hypothetical protein [Chryseobacterium sp. MEBOG07]|uniref:hypothetical protein n=1 Tax=Chryseobacterium sp. MEBOG07 TaxID=2879939 RepID=UPI001F15A489|nr:hypothetical protein [Chryseobacterium sp. MEBOG07]UKB78322.1 hypothetical protein LF886_17825 [Chryseobacterium sp. MEBOG07]
MLKFLKEYFTIIVFIPTLLGGGVQVYQLVSLSPSLIQFFSFSQLLIDGILILIRSPLYLIGILSYSFYLAIKDDKRERIKFWITLFFGLAAFSFSVRSIYIEKSYYQIFKYLIFFGANILFIFIYKLIGNAKISLKIMGLVISSILFSMLLNILDKQLDYSSIENVSLLTEKVKIRYPKAEFRCYNDRFVIFENTANKRYVIKEFGDLFKEEIIDNNSKK